jgi:hypothetical protein
MKGWRPTLILAGALALPACAGPTGTRDPAICHQTYEFGNSGCAEVRGRVVLPSGQPVVGASVGVMGPADPELSVGMNRAYVDTDSAGYYLVRVIRYAPSVGQPDTLTVSVRAGLRPPPGTPVGVPGPMAFTTAVLEFSPVGEHARVVEAPVITLRASTGR